MALFIIVFIIIIVLCVICHNAAERNNAITRIKSLTLEADKTGNPYIPEQIESLCSLYRISQEEYQYIRKSMYYEMAKNDDIFALWQCFYIAHEEKQKNDCHFYLKMLSDFGETTAMIFLGQSYSLFLNMKENFLGFGHNPEESFRLFSRAASLGDTDAYEYVAEAYFWGDGVPIDREYAFSYARQYASQGYSSVTLFLIDHYYLSKSSAQYDIDEALRLYSAVLSRREPKYFVSAIRGLGHLYLELVEANDFKRMLCNDLFVTKRTAAYCYFLAYTHSRDSKDWDQFIKSNYSPSEFEKQKWHNDAINFSYNPTQ